MFKPFSIICTLTMLTGCVGEIPNLHVPKSTKLTATQNCAIGYDLARQIYNTVSLRDTIIIAPTRESACEHHALNYLKKSGFAVDETQKAPSFDITLTSNEDGNITAVASIGRVLKIARSYTPANLGVFPASAVSIIKLPANSYRRNGAGQGI
jgi:hypothetical protein